MRLSAGSRVGHYILKRRLGVGGMAEVWAAHHGLLGIDVALKILFREGADQHARLLREGRAQAAMDHPNILPVRDVIDVNGAPALVLPLVAGPSLKELLRRYRPTEPESIALFCSIVEGVAHAHERGLVHRDLKPGNILLEPRRGQLVPRISDFGLVKDTRTLSQTRDGAMMGSPNYAAPEQLLDAARADHRADLFSLGVLLAELLSGTLPFQSRSLGELLEKHRGEPDLSGVPAAWLPACQALLQISPDERPDDCAALRTLLGEHDASVLVAGTPLFAAARWAHEAEARTPEPYSDTDMSGTAAGSGLESRPPPDNLPDALDDFVGRQADLAALSSCVVGERLVTVLGAGGIGKTRLALQLARQQQGMWSGGIWFCDLSEARTPEGIVMAVAQALGVSLGIREPDAVLCHAINGRRRCLLVLDNFEQLVEHAEETVGRWLEGAPQAHILVTSRAPLGLSAEHPLRLAPLSATEATELFATRAQARKPTFTVDDSNRSDVAALIRLLDGLPLAIELAAARIGVVSPAGMVSRMGQRFRLLAPNRRGAQQTLWATIDWSWSLLEDWEKLGFSQLSAFEGGFTLDAAEAVLDLSATPGAPWPMDVVQSLVDRSLVRSLPGERFGMLMSLQEYAAEKRGDDPTLLRRHAAYFARFGEASALEALDCRGGEAHRRQVVAERSNFEAAASRAVALGDPELATHAAEALAWLANRRGPFQSGLRAVEATLAMLQGGEHDALRTTLVLSKVSLLEGLGRLKDGLEHGYQGLALARACGDQAAEASLLFRIGSLHNTLGNPQQAEACFQEALRGQQALGRLRHEALAQGALGSLYKDQGRVEEAEPYLRAALLGHQAAGDRRLTAYVHALLGSLDRHLGRMEAAGKHYRKALALYEQAGERRLKGGLLTSLGILHKRRGLLDEAKAFYQDAIQIHREVGNRRQEALAQGNLASLMMLQGELRETEEMYQQSIATLQEVGDREMVTVMLSNLAGFFEEEGRLDEAEACYQRVLATQRALRYRKHEAHTLNALASLLINRGRLAEAEPHLRQAVEIADDVGDVRVAGMALCNLGEIQARSGRYAESRAHFTASEARMRSAHIPVFLSGVLCYRAQMEHNAGNPGVAQQLFAEARQIAAALSLKPGAHLTQLIQKLTEELFSPP